MKRKAVYEGRAVMVSELARQRGKNYFTVVSRLNRGWTIEEALTAPILKRRPPGPTGKKKDIATLAEWFGSGVDEWCERLAAAIVQRAVLDYQHEEYREEVEEFFRSRWFALLYDLDGEELLRKLEKIYRKG